MISKERQLEKAVALNTTLFQGGYFGEVTFQFEHGNLVYVLIAENRRITTLEAQQQAKEAINSGQEFRVRPASQPSTVIATQVKKGLFENVFSNDDD